MRKLTIAFAILLFGLMLKPVSARGPLPEAGQAYTVQAGDSLSQLAAEAYGDINAWPAIWLGTWVKAVEDDSFTEIDDPDLIEVGQKLWIPDKTKAERFMTKVGYICLGWAYFEEGEYERALAQFDKVIELYPHDPAAYLDRAYIFRQLEQYERAMTDLDKAIELDPDDAGAYNNRGFNYAEMEQFEKAIADYNQALKLRSNYEHVDYLYNNRGFAYGRLGQYNLAFADFERVEALNPDNAWLYYYRAMIYLKMGENDKARSELELSLQFDDPPLDQKRKARAEALLR